MADALRENRSTLLFLGVWTGGKGGCEISLRLEGDFLKSIVERALVVFESRVAQRDMRQLPAVEQGGTVP